MSLNFSQGVNTIIGENGSGKTNILQALRLLIDENLPRHVKLYESDFNRSLLKWKGHWIVIQVTFDDLDTAEEAQAIAMHMAGSMEELDFSKGSYSLIFRPRESVRRQIYDYSLIEDKSQAGLELILSYLSLDDYEAVFRGRGSADFSDDEIYREYVGDFENVVFPDPDMQQSHIFGIKISGFSIPNEISCTFIKALRDVEADLRSYRDNPLLSLLRGKEKNIEVSEKKSIIDKVQALNSEITGLDEVKNVSGGISQSIREAVGETYAPSIDIRSELPEDMEKLLQSLKLWVGDPDEEDHKGRIWELSLGGANLIYFSLKLLEYEKVKSENKIANFLLIEEPEAHIHTHIQKTLFQKLHNHNTQIIITTHSTHISSVSKISSLNVLSRSNKHAVVFNPSNGLVAEEVTGIERYLDAVRTNLMFAKGVLMVEGDAEQIMIPTLISKVFGVSLDEIGISLVNIGSTGFENIAVLFNDNRLRKKCSILTDLDASILDLPEDENDDTKEQTACRNSQESGAARKIRLDAFCKDNQWVKPFYAKNTFEVDFLDEGNAHEVKLVVKKKYTQEASITRISQKLDSSEISVAGSEILRLADKFGKGWFAIMVSDEVTHLTTIPPYITQAIAFAAKNMSPNIMLQMMRYRLGKLNLEDYSGSTRDYNQLLLEVSAIPEALGAINYYLDRLPDDQLSTFVKVILK